MTEVIFNIDGRRDSQIFIENLQKTSSKELDNLMNQYGIGKKSSWHRFIRSAYNHPITWWIGLIQIQMQIGVWGFSRKTQAQTTANQLAQIINLAKNNANKDIVYRIFVFNLKHRKADVLGRLAGGVFTNYATSGGSIGKKILPRSAKISVTLSNFLLSSYGAAIKSIIENGRTIEDIIQSILTGQRNESSTYPDASNHELSEEEIGIYSKLEAVLAEIAALTQISPPPVPISEFCIRPENIDLKGLCK
jgi:hypothetical protein